ncbi:MAG: recombinase family protein [Eubacteriales bacterium]|nr:recombinase family protein [Eubacteriales bacterium]
MPTIAIYPRKSRFTGKGESVQTQIDLCRDYCDTHFDSPSYLIYDEDEGYSGGNVKRPAFQRMMADARKRKFSVLCCYRLDRISRNVSDFSRTLDELHSLGISFVSLREQFDTSTPMGRAMIYISSVFAQLERDTLTERIVDNLQMLAKEGRWLGGTTPTGYHSERVSFERGGKSRQYNVLVEYPPELDIVRTLFRQYLEKQSFAGVETYCLQHCITSRTGKNYSRATIKAILLNPVYCTADRDAWIYFSAGDYNLCVNEADFDGSHGIQPFGRTDSDRPSAVLRPTEDWIIAVGHHTGAISGADWVQAQRLMQSVKDSAYHAPRTKTALLSGLLICADCSSYMRPKMHSRIREDGSRGITYTCMLKSSSRSQRCRMRNADAQVVDQLVLSHLADLAGNNGEFTHRAANDQLEITHRKDDLAAQLDARRSALDSLRAQQRDWLLRLSDLSLSPAVVHGISDEVERLGDQIADAEKDITRIQGELSSSQRQTDALDMMGQLMAEFKHPIVSLDFDEQRRLLKTVIERVLWDGENATVELFGEKCMQE